MNDFVTEFEYYITNRWMLEGKHYNSHGLYQFYTLLWNGEANELKTPYGSVKRVDSSTDYEDGQEERVMILQVGDRFVKKVGYYDSWESSNWDGSITEVKPVQKTVTVYEAV
jgi:hypothetical protein